MEQPLTHASNTKKQKQNKTKQNKTNKQTQTKKHDASMKHHTRPDLLGDTTLGVVLLRKN